jgi:deoxyribonuclease V
MDIKHLHNWNLSFAQARSLQTDLAAKLKFAPIKKKPETVAGLDCAFSQDGTKICAAVVVLKFDDFEVVEIQKAVAKVTFPYVPGLLSFREAPVCIKAAGKLKITPDIFIIDGQGIAHPRRLGLAAHLGLFFNRPTIGCAKSRLVGTFDDPPCEKGNYSLLKDKNETIGAVLRTRTNVKPVFVSVGNKCLLEDAINIILSCAIKYRLGEPTRQAHKTVTKLRVRI